MTSTKRGRPLKKAAGSTFFLLLLAPSSAEAFDWGSLASTCGRVKLPAFQQFIADANAWEALQLRTKQEIHSLANEICPEYLQSANGAQALGHSGPRLTLEAYIARHTGTFQHAGETTGRARSGDTYLSTHFDRIAAIQGAVGWDFPGSTCGAAITAARKHYAQVISAVRALSEETGRKCAALSEKISALGPGEKAPARPGQGAPAGTHENPASTITGQISGKREAEGNSGTLKVERAVFAKPAATEALAALGKGKEAAREGGSTLPRGPSSPSPLLSSPPELQSPTSPPGRAPASLQELRAEARSQDEKDARLETFGAKLGASSGEEKLARSEEFVVAEMLSGEGGEKPLVAVLSGMAAEKNARAARHEPTLFETVRTVIQKRARAGAFR